MSEISSISKMGSNMTAHNHMNKINGNSFNGQKNMKGAEVNSQNEMPSNCNMTDMHNNTSTRTTSPSGNNIDVRV